MELQTVQIESATPAGSVAMTAHAARRVAEHRFRDLLAPRDGKTDRLGPSREQQARQAAEQLVAGTLIRPLLQQMQRDPFRSELMHGGFAEDAFADQLHTVLADRITRRVNLPIVDAVYHRIIDAAERTGTSSEAVNTHA